MSVNRKISNLPNVVAASIQDTDILPIVAAGVTSNVKISDLRVKLGTNPPAGGRTVTDTATYLLNNAVFNVKDFGAFGDDSHNDLTAVTAAITAAGVAGGLVLFPTGVYRINASFSIPANVILQGFGRAASVLKRMHSNDFITAIGANAGIEKLKIDGNVASFPATGRGVVVASAVGGQKFIDTEISNFPLACLEFAVADAGSEFKSIGCTYYTTGALGTVAAVKVTGTDTQAIPRHFYATSSAGCTLFDFGGCNDFFASGFYTNGFIFAALSSKVTLSNFRCGAAAGRQTIKGSSHQMAAGVFAVGITLDATTAGVNLGNCEVAGYDISDAGVNNRFSATFDYGPGSPSFFTAAWTSDGVAPVLNNGTLNGIVTRDGRSVRVNLKLTIGSTTTFGTGQYFFNLPYLDYSAYRFLGDFWAQKSASPGPANNYIGTARVIPGQQKVSAYFNATTTPLSATNPSTWASGDEIDITIEYTAR